MDRRLCLLAALAALPAPAATRLKDLAGIEGVRDNQLIGYGLVVGLAGKGDTPDDLVLAAEPGQHAGAHGRLGSGRHHSASRTPRR